MVTVDGTLDGAAVGVSHNNQKRDIKLIHTQLKRSLDSLVGDIAGVAYRKYVADAPVEDKLYRRA